LAKIRGLLIARKIIMDEDVKTRFDDMDKRYGALEKRFDDIKWYFGGVTTLFSLGFGVLTIVISWNFNANITGLREFEKQLKEEIGKIDSPADIDILGVNGASIDGQDVDSDVEVDKDGDHWLRISHFLRNRGEGSSGPMFLKLYTKDPIRLDSLSTDNSKFKYEGVITPENLSPKEIPGKFSNQWFHRFFLPDKQTIPPGRYDAAVKVFYGRGKATEAKITLVVRDSKPGPK
jgi:hypothetical protein